MQQIFKNYILLLLSALLLFSCASSKKQKPKKMAHIYFKEGTRDLIEQNYTAALDKLTKAEHYSPEDPEILNNLGMAYLFKKRPNMAIEKFKLALKFNKDNVDARLNIATIYLNQGKLAQAEKMYLGAIENDLTYKNHFRTYFNLGIISEKRNNIKEAHSFFRKSIIEENRYCPPHLKLGEFFMNSKNYSAALKHYKSANTGSCADQPIAHYYQAMNHLNLKQYDSARFKFKEVMTRFPESTYYDKAKMKLDSFQSQINQLEQ